MAAPAAVILMGLRGSGKSTVGARLAALLSRRFVDLDAVTARAAGQADAGDALRALGEPAFRQAEAAALRQVLAESTAARPVVLALGGGTPTAPGAEALLRDAQKSGHAMLFYLDVPPDRLAGRLAGDPGNRPLLKAGEVYADLVAAHGARHGLFQSLADFSVVARHDDPERTAQSIVMAIQTREDAHPGG